MIGEEQEEIESYNRIPKKIEIFGRTISTVDDSAKLNFIRSFGEARYGVNQIALTDKFADDDIPVEELKLTYLHEMLHFILNFTGYEKILRETGTIDLEQFIELMSSGIYQYEKSARY